LITRAYEADTVQILNPAVEIKPPARGALPRMAIIYSADAIHRMELDDPHTDHRHTVDFVAHMIEYGFNVYRLGRDLHFIPRGPLQ
jgi:hypothetical protein